MNSSQVNDRAPFRRSALLTASSKMPQRDISRRAVIARRRSRRGNPVPCSHCLSAASPMRSAKSLDCRVGCASSQWRWVRDGHRIARWRRAFL